MLNLRLPRCMGISVLGGTRLGRDM
eukprot:COSAG02_NODE_55799_length_288_cov_1.100529_1_plen_24_part_01